MGPPSTPRPASHRGAPRAGETARRLVPALTAVSAVVIVIALLLFLNSRPTHTRGPGPGVVAAPPSTSASATTAASSAPTASSAPSSSSVPAVPAAAAPTTPPVSEPPATQRPTSVRPPVTVLNNSRIQGLAHHAAAQVAAGGWPVAEVGNFTGRIAESTIYYAAGQRGAAEAFARRFSGVRRVLPRFEGLPGRGLTLVVTRDWPE